LIAAQALIVAAHESKLDKQQYRRLVDQRYLFRNSAILDRHDNFNPKAPAIRELAAAVTHTSATSRRPDLLPS